MLLRRMPHAAYGLERRSMQCSVILPRTAPRLAYGVAIGTKSRARHSSRSNHLKEGVDRYWLFSSLLVLGVSVYALELPALQLEALPPVEKDESPYRLDPSTSQPFPLTLPSPITSLPSQCKELTLVGLGVRTVSFLRVRVYVAGLYMDNNALERLSGMEGWTGFRQAWMTDSNDNHSGEDLLAALLDQGIAFAIRIVPVRPTDYGHLRDGFTRAIQGRAKLARKQGQLTDSADEALSHSLQDLKDAFPRASLPKGQALDLIFAPCRSGIGYDLALEEGGKVLGRVDSPQGAKESQFSVARQLFLAYFADQNEISKPFKESVAQGFERAIRA